MKYGRPTIDDPDYLTTVRPGHFLATRNTAEVGNDSPGHWNHIAVVGHNGWVVEAQKEPNAVIAVPFDLFVDRYPDVLALALMSTNRLVYTDGILDSIAMEAAKLVGKKYRPAASIIMRWRRKELGENCVSVARKATALAVGRDFQWRRPDHVVQVCSLVCGKCDYDGWQKPDIWFEGMTKRKKDLAFEPKVRQ